MKTDDLFRKIASPAYGPNKEEQIRNKARMLASTPSELANDLSLHYRNSKAFPSERDTFKKFLKNKKGGKKSRRTRRRRTINTRTT